MVLWQLAGVFAVLSALGFGGGNAILPQMYADVVTQHHWLTGPEFSRFYGLSRLSPGPAMGVSALVGYAVAGFAGAVVAAIAMFVPAAVIVYGLAHLWDRFHDHPARKLFARAMIPIILGFSWVGAVILGQGSVDGWQTGAIALLACAAMLMTKMNTAAIVGIAGVAGAVLFR
jgi:chromate transporter